MLWKRSAFSLAQELPCIVRSIPCSSHEGNEQCGGETMLGQPCHMDKGQRVTCSSLLTVRCHFDHPHDPSLPHMLSLSLLSCLVSCAGTILSWTGKAVQ